MYNNIYIYIYIEGERERERKGNLKNLKNLWYFHPHRFIYVYFPQAKYLDTITFDVSTLKTSISFGKFKEVPEKKDFSRFTVLLRHS